MSDGRVGDFQGTERFTIIRRIGAGGMGVVYEAHDAERDARVALKTLLRIDARSLYRFKQEFRALSDVVHPNLVALHELISAGERWFFTMELVRGVNFLEYVRGPSWAPTQSGSFSTVPVEPVRDPAPNTQQTTDYVENPATEQPQETEAHSQTLAGLAIQPAWTGSARSGPLSDPAQFRRLRHGLAQLVQGICALHQAGKLHRDIKPSNVLVTARGPDATPLATDRVVLLDFGLVTELAPGRGADATPLAEENEDELAGTVGYMSPEQLSGLALTPASDWYAVGVILYEALAGQRLFSGTSLEVARAEQCQDQRFPTTLPSGLPADLADLCVDLLRRRPEARPTGPAILARLTGETQNQRSAVRGQGSDKEPTPPRSPGARSVFVGRERHLQALSDAYHATTQGHPVTVYVHGPSGMGKSHLLQRFLEELRAREDVIVLSGRCYERESVPYKALDILVDALSTYLRRLPDAGALMPRDAAALARLFPVLREFVPAVDEVRGHKQPAETPDPHELRRRAFTALRELLTQLGQRRGLLLYIDDLQWGDADSAALLADLLRPPDAPVLCLVCAYRSEYARTSPCLLALAEIRNTAAAMIDWRELSVEPLSLQEARNLACRLLGPEKSNSDVWPDLIARESGGNPYLVGELVQYLEAGADLDAQLGALTQPRSPGSAGLTLDEVLWHRVARLPEMARGLLEIISVSGQPLTRGDAYRAAGLSSADPTPLSVLRAAHLVRGAGPGEQDEVETYHDRVRETVTTHLPAETIKRHHRALALTLEAAARADPETLAVHFQGSADLSKAGIYYGIAADKAAEALAFDRAAKLYRLAVDLAPQTQAARLPLQTKLADALANAGRGPEAAREYQALAQETDGNERLEMERRAAYQYLISGQLDPGYDAIQRVLGRIGVRLPRRPLWSLLWHRARLKIAGLRHRERPPTQIPSEDLSRIDILSTAATGLAVADTLRATDLQARHLLLALRVGEPVRLARALVREASHLSLAGTSTQRAIDKYLNAARAIASRIDSPMLTGLIALAQGETTFFHGHWAVARGHCERAEEIFRDHCPGMTWELDSAQSFIGWSLALMGDLPAMRRRLPLLIKEARERGDLFVETNLATYAAPFLWLADDDPQGGRLVIQDVMGRWSHRGVHSQHYMAIGGLTHIDLYRRDGVAAWHRLKAEWPGLRKALLLHIETIRIDLVQMRIRSALAAAASQGTNRSLWLRAAQADLRLLERETAPWSAPYVLADRAVLATMHGQKSEAAELLGRAASGFDQTPMRLYASAARRRQGELLGEKEVVSRADAWMTEQGIRRPELFAAMLIPGLERERRGMKDEG
jgi:serine/threonine protein kinase